MSYQQVSKLESNKEVVHFSNALIQSGYVIPEVQISPFIEPYNPFKCLSRLGLGLVIGKEKSDILNLTR